MEPSSPWDPDSWANFLGAFGCNKFHLPIREYSSSHTGLRLAKVFNLGCCHSGLTCLCGGLSRCSRCFMFQLRGCTDKGWVADGDQRERRYPMGLVNLPSQRCCCLRYPWTPAKLIGSIWSQRGTNSFFKCTVNKALHRTHFYQTVAKGYETKTCIGLPENCKNHVLVAVRKK